LDELAEFCDQALALLARERVVVICVFPLIQTETAYVLFLTLEQRAWNATETAPAVHRKDARRARPSSPLI
jgi:hypothetical protein